MAVMKPEESDLLLAMLDENAKAPADLAAATTWLPVTDTDIVVVQAHRVDGIDAAATVDAWIELLSLSLEEPVIAQDVVGETTVMLVSDATRPEVPLLYLFPAGDVMWMVVADEVAIVEEAVAAAAATGTSQAEPAE
jgi:hypothetical protein